jgi:hypothetical protein
MRTGFRDAGTDCCVPRVTETMLAAEAKLARGEGRNVTQKSKRCHLLEEEFVGFFRCGEKFL